MQTVHYSALVALGLWYLCIAMVGFFIVIAAYRTWEQSEVRQLRQRLADVSARVIAADKYSEHLMLRRDEALNALERALIDLHRAERKLARARTSRDRRIIEAAEWHRLYRNEFKRADRAETQLMRWQYDRKYAWMRAPHPIATGSNGRDVP